MDHDEYKERMSNLMAQVKALSDEFFKPAIDEYLQLLDAGSSPHCINISALARKHGVPSAPLSRKLNETIKAAKKRISAQRYSADDMAIIG